MYEHDPPDLLTAATEYLRLDCRYDDLTEEAAVAKRQLRAAVAKERASVLKALTSWHKGECNMEFKSTHPAVMGDITVTVRQNEYGTKFWYATTESGSRLMSGIYLDETEMELKDWVNFNIRR